MRKTRKNSLWNIAGKEFKVFGLFLFLILCVFGPFHAVWGAERSESAKRAAPEGVSKAEIERRMESIDALIEKQPINQETRTAMKAKARELARWEMELQLRERAVADLQKEVEQKLAELEKKRTELLSLTETIDEKRQAELMQAVAIFKKMEPVDAAKFLNAMDQQLVVAVLRQLSSSAAGEMLTRMQEQLENMGKDPQDPNAPVELTPEEQAEQEALRQKLISIGETLVDSYQTTP